jgi:hypothetical protein
MSYTIKNMTVVNTLDIECYEESYLKVKEENPIFHTGVLHK